MIDQDLAIASREARRDLAAGAFSAGLAAFLAAVHFRQEGRLHDDFGTEPGPALLPAILLVALVLIGFMLLLRGFWAARIAGLTLRKQKELEGDAFGYASLFVFALLVAALFAQSIVGLGVAIAVTSALLAVLLARQERRPLPRAAIEGVLVAGILYAMFRLVLGVPLT